MLRFLKNFRPGSAITVRKTTMNENSTCMLETMTETQTITVDMTEPQTEPKFSLRLLCLQNIGFVFLCVIIFGLVIRIFIRDSSTIARAVYYALPWPILAVLAMCVGLIYQSLAKRIMARLMFVFVIGFFVWWGCLIWQVSFTKSEMVNAKPIRVVF